VQVDDLQDFEDPSTITDPVAVALDRTLTARAFRSLPERWQSVLWYTEVEGMDPHEVAPILGMSANGVAALSYRAREGLRKAWLQAHVSSAGVSEECRWTISRLGESARHALTPREDERMKKHLASCAKCSIISEEVDEVGSHLAMVLIPIAIGGIAGGALLAGAAHTGGAVATAASIPAAPASFTVLAGSTAAPTVAAGLSMGAATGVSALIGSAAVIVAVGGGIAAGMVPQNSEVAPQARTVAADQVAPTPSAPPAVPTPTPTAPVPASVPTSLPTAAAGAVGSVVGGVKTTVVDPLLGALTPKSAPPGQAAPPTGPVTTTVTLGGTGTPGATIAAQVAGAVWATTRVQPNGTWSLAVSAVPTGSTVQLKQTLLSVLGVDLVTVPITLNAHPLGIVVSLLQ
jgi:hypothetical protein